MRRLWRCTNCRDDSGKKNLEFVAVAGEHGKGVCPKCRAGSNPRTAERIVALIVIHFDPPSGVEGVGLGVNACTGEPRQTGQRASGVTDAVNCPKCRASTVFKLTAEDQAKHPGYDIPDEVPKPGPEPVPVPEPEESEVE